MLPRGSRLASGDDIRDVIKKGKRLSSPYFVLHYLSSDTNQFAFITGRVLGNAVVRNKIKRRISSCVRENIGALGLPISGVLRMRADAFDCEWSDLEAAVQKVFEKVEA